MPGVWRAIGCGLGGAGQAKEKVAVTLKKSKRKKRLFWVVAAALVVALQVGPGLYTDYRMRNLKEIDPAEYQKTIKVLEAQVAKVPASEFDENLRLYKKLQSLNPENKRYAEKISYYREQKTAAAKAAKAKKVAAEAAAAVAGKAAKAKKAGAEAAVVVEKKRKGFHCLSAWDGSHRGVKTYVEERMREPDSFEHIETRIMQINEKGKHTLTMRYRARNGFGGMTDGVAIATINNAGCSAMVELIE